MCFGVQSIRRAHANVKPGKLRVNSGELLEANANRSPSAYLHNPEEERARYQYNTDKIMTQLSVTDSAGKGDQIIISCMLTETLHVYQILPVRLLDNGLLPFLTVIVWCATYMAGLHTKTMIRLIRKPGQQPNAVSSM